MPRRVFRMEHRWPWPKPSPRVTILAVVALASVLLGACGGGRGANQAASLTARITAILDRYEAQMSDIAAHIGCVVYLMRTQPESDGRLAAYTQVVCQQCPISRTSTGWIMPWAFVLHGQTVVQTRAANDQGDPGFYNQIKEIFPKSLWTEASEQQIPNVESLTRRAAKIGDC